MWCNFPQDGAKIKFLSWLSSNWFVVDICVFIKLLFLIENIYNSSAATKWRVICLVSVITIMNN
ncbi:hypothetical protein FCV44_03605 [Vibrio kanaloae]|nr:hypothetical protein FCV44_03605 [Vibrio kanaloae]TKF14648.1 hypothetical protein FCV47_15205 [Vibrio kanaloae]